MQFVVRVASYCYISLIFFVEKCETSEITVHKGNFISLQLFFTCFLCYRLIPSYHIEILRFGYDQWQNMIPSFGLSSCLKKREDSKLKIKILKMVFRNSGQSACKTNFVSILISLGTESLWFGRSKYPIQIY